MKSRNRNRVAFFAAAAVLGSWQLAAAPEAMAQTGSGAPTSDNAIGIGNLGGLTLPATPTTPNTTFPTQDNTDQTPNQPQVSGVVRVINIQGNVNISQDAIRSVMQQKIGDQFNVNSEEADRQAIQDMGYFSAVTDHVEMGPGDNSVTITYTVVENPKVTRIVFTGNRIESSDKLITVMQTKAGQVLNINFLSRDIQNLINIYTTAGYRASISEQINLDDKTGILTIPVVEARISSIAITGNHKTKSYVVTREMKTRVGQPYNEILFRRDLTRVFNLGLFDSVGPADISTPDVGKVALTIPVKEKQTGQVSVGLGYSTIEKIVGRASLSESNFRGRGETASVSFEVASVDSQSSAEVSFGDPFIDKNHTGFNIDLYDRVIYRFSSSFINTSSSGSTVDYFERHIGGILTFSRPVTDTSTVFLSGRTESVRSNNVAVPLQDSFIRQDDNISGLGLRLVRNTRDNEFNPAAGGYDSVSVEGVTSTTNTVGNAPTPLRPGRHDFLKYGLDLRRYISLQGPRRKSLTEPKRVLAFRLLAGFTQKDIPFSEEYFLGGADSLRGFVDERFWGSNLLLLNSEVRIPVASSLTGVLFVDAGDAWGSIYQGFQGASLQQDQTFRIEAAVGVGARVTTPIGAIRIDYGYGRYGGKADFSIGQSF